jgi:hypothetical protein
LLSGSSARCVANSGGDILAIKLLGGWKSSAAVAEGYVDSSLSNKIHVSKMFAQEQTLTSLVVPQVLTLVAPQVLTLVAPQVLTLGVPQVLIQMSLN